MRLGGPTQVKQNSNSTQNIPLYKGSHGDGPSGEGVQEFTGWWMINRSRSVSNP